MAADKTPKDGSGVDKIAFHASRFGCASDVSAWRSSLLPGNVIPMDTAASKEQGTMMIEGFNLAGSSVLKEEVFRHMDLLERFAQRRFPDEVLAGKAFLYVLDSLAANDWKRVRQFQGRHGSSFRTYLAHIAQRLLTDFYRAEFGYERPPKWVEEMGGLWKRAYRLLCIEHWSPEEAMERLRAPSGGESRNEAVAEAIELILEKSPDCTKLKPEMAPTDPGDLDTKAPNDPALHDLSPEEALSGRQLAAIMEAIHHCLTAPEEGLLLSPDQERLRSKLLELRSEIRLSPLEYQFLSLYSQEDLTVASAGRKLGLGIDQASGRFRRLMARIDLALGKVGIKKELRGSLD